MSAAPPFAPAYPPAVRARLQDPEYVHKHASKFLELWDRLEKAHLPHRLRHPAPTDPLALAWPPGDDEFGPVSPAAVQRWREWAKPIAFFLADYGRSRGTDVHPLRTFALYPHIGDREVRRVVSDIVTDTRLHAVENPPAKPSPRRRAGRPVDTNPAEDRKLAEEWGHFHETVGGTMAEFANHKGTRAKEIRLALDRHRKRQQSTE